MTALQPLAERAPSTGSFLDQKSGTVPLALGSMCEPSQRRGRHTQVQAYVQVQAQAQGAEEPEAIEAHERLASGVPSPTNFERTTAAATLGLCP